MPVLTDHRALSVLADGHQLTVDELALRVRVSARRKRFALTVEADAEITLHAPAACPVADAEEFVRAHRAWVVRKLGIGERNRPLNPAKRLVDGELFRYLGRTYRLALIEDSPTSGAVRLVGGRLVMGQEQASDADRGRVVLIDWYCQTGLAWAAGRLQPWAARMAVAEPTLAVGDLNRRWGRYQPESPDRCGSGRLSLGWQLFQLPMHLVDYVIAHELAHIRVPGHPPGFWRLLRSALPEYEARRSELDELGRRMWMGHIAA